MLTKKMMTNAITCSILDSPSTSDDDDMNKGDSKSTRFEPTIKHLFMETRLDHRSERNLVMRGYNIRVKLFIMDYFSMK